MTETSRVPGERRSAALLEEIARLGRVQDEMRAAHEAEIARARDDVRRSTALLDSLPEAVFVLRAAEGVIRYVNAAGVGLVRAADAEALLGRPFTDIVHPDDRAACVERHARILAGEPREAVARGRLLALDGAAIDVEGSVTKAEREAEPVLYCVVRDVSPLVEALSALRDSEARFRELSESSIQGMNVVTLDARARPLYANAAFLEMFGFDSLETYVEEASDDAIVAAHERERLRGQRADGADPPAEIEFDGRRRDGTHIRVRRRTRALSRPWTGQPALLGIHVDVTDRARAEAALEASFTRFRDLAESSLQGICVTTTGERWETLYVNDAFVSLFGFESADHALGREIITMVIAPHERDRAYGYRRARLEGIPSPDDYEMDGQRADGSPIRVRVMVRLLERPWDGQRAALATFVDVTDRHLAERERERHRGHLEGLVAERTRELSSAREQLARSARLAALGHATAAVGHELRNPLGTMTTSLAMLRRPGTEGERAERAMARIDRAIARCREIVDEMLDFTRDQPLERRPVNAATWLDGALEAAAAAVDVPVEGIPGCSDRVTVDAHRMGQVLVNLVRNAAHATLERHPDAPPPVTVRTARAGDELVIEVSDQGAGMADEVRERVFEPLFSTKPRGVGLGMPLVAKVVDQHGGSIEVESAPDAGTTVTVRVPAGPGTCAERG